MEINRLTRSTIILLAVLLAGLYLASMTVEPVSAINKTYKPKNMDKGTKIDKTNMEKKDKDSTTGNEVTNSENTEQGKMYIAGQRWGPEGGKNIHYVSYLRPRPKY